MEYRDDEMELSEEELMNVQSNVPFDYYEKLDEVEKIFGNRSKKELEAIKEILEAGRQYQDPFRSGRGRR